MCLPYLAVLNLSQPEKDLLLHPKAERGQYFGTSTARIAIINAMMRMRLVERHGYNQWGTPRWALSGCGLRASKLLKDLDNYPLLRDKVIDDYNEQRQQCPRTKPPKQPKSPSRAARNPRPKKSKQEREQIKRKICQWVERRIELQKPISYRFLSLFIYQYSKDVGISQQEAHADFRNCGIYQILMVDPTHPDFPRREDWLYETARWMWNRRDLRPNPERYIQ